MSFVIHISIVTLIRIAVVTEKLCIQKSRPNVRPADETGEALVRELGKVGFG